MRAIFIADQPKYSWAEQLFNGYSPFLLPFCNKPYLEFVIDLCILSGIDRVRIVTNAGDSLIQEALGDGGRFGLELSYSYTNNPSVKSTISKNKAFCAGDDLIVFRGMAFFQYDKNHPETLEKTLEIPQDSLCGDSDGDGGYFLIGRDMLNAFPDHGENLQLPPEPLRLRFSTIDSVKKYYDLNMNLIRHHDDHYNLPGFGSGAFISGRNVEIPKSAEIKTPVMLGSNVQIGRDCVVGPGVAIGDNSLIDKQALLRNTIVFGNTYIGCNLEIENKICCRNNLIDPERAVKIDIIDEFLLTEVVKAGHWRCPLMQRISALFLLIAYFPAFVVLRPLIRIHATEVECFMNQQRKRKLKLRLYVLPPHGISGKLFLKLSLDRYHLLPMVLPGKLRLVGSRILEVSDDNARMLEQFPDYAPGIFSYSEYLEHENDPVQSEMDELYYMYHAGFWSNLKILKGILLRNLLKRT